MFNENPFELRGPSTLPSSSPELHIRTWGEEQITKVRDPDFEPIFNPRCKKTLSQMRNSIIWDMFDLELVGVPPEEIARC